MVPAIDRKATVNIMEFVLWERKYEDYSATLEGIQGVEDEWEINEGISKINTFLNTVSFQMNREKPNDLILLDSIPNIDFLIVASFKLMSFLKKQEIKKIEFLPVTIIDHKSNTLPNDFFIIHPIEPIDCLDAKRCGAIWNKLDPEYIKRLNRIAFNEEFISMEDSQMAERKIFRAKNFYRVTFVSKELAKAIDSEGFTGIRWVDTQNYPFPRG